MPTWLPGIITPLLPPLNYYIQLKGRRVWEGHIDHIQQNEEIEKQNSMPWPEGVEP